MDNEGTLKKPFNFPTFKSKDQSSKALTNPKIKSYTFLENDRIAKSMLLNNSPGGKKQRADHKTVIGDDRSWDRRSKSKASVDDSLEDSAFITRKEYIDKSSCNICSKDFSSLLIQKMKKKHCKICGFAVCGDCSQRRVKDHRACDLCVWKLTNKQSEEVKEEYLVTYEEAVKELEIDLQTMEAKNDELKSMTLTLSTETENEKNQAMKIVTDLEVEIDRNRTIELEKRQNFEKQANDLRTLTEELKSLKAEFTAKEAENKQRKAELEKKKNSYEEKSELFKRLQDDLKRLCQNNSN